MLAHLVPPRRSSDPSSGRRRLVKAPAAVHPPPVAERVPQLMLDIGCAAVTAAETRPKGADYPALRDQANGLGRRTRLLFGRKP
jgi:hypothetical protein